MAQKHATKPKVVSRQEFESADTFHGLERIVASKSEMLLHLRNAINMHSHNRFRRGVTNKRVGHGDGFIEVEYKFARLADTFFSDTLDRETLKDVLSTAEENDVPCQIMFLNPFSDHARVRALNLDAEKARKSKSRNPLDLSEKEQRALDRCEDWLTAEVDVEKRGQLLDEMLEFTLGRAFVGLNAFSDVLFAMSNETAIQENSSVIVSEEEARQEIKRILDYLSKMQGVYSGIEFRFTSDLLVLPIYIFGDYCYRGILMPRDSAVDKPWSIYRDDPGRVKDDMFEATLEAFDQAWRDAINVETMRDLLDKDTTQRKQRAEAQDTIMVAYSEDNKWALDQVTRLVKEVSSDKVKTIHFRLENGTSDVPRDAIERMLRSASAGIVLMFNDEKIERSRRRNRQEVDSSERYRSRQNVIHEMGLMQSSYGFGRVLILTEENQGITFEFPSNIIGMNREKVAIDKDRIEERMLRGTLNEFLTNLKKPK